MFKATFWGIIFWLVGHFSCFHILPMLSVYQHIFYVTNLFICTAGLFWVVPMLECECVCHKDVCTLLFVGLHLSKLSAHLYFPSTSSFSPHLCGTCNKKNKIKQTDMLTCAHAQHVPCWQAGTYKGDKNMLWFCNVFTELYVIIWVELMNNRNL